MELNLEEALRYAGVPSPPPEELPPTLIMGYARLEAGDIRRAFLRLREAWGIV